MRKKAGHRSWAPKGGKVKGGHNGDIMSIEKRSKLMSKIKSKNTKPELIIVNLLKQSKYNFTTHYSELPGKPDIVFINSKVAIFIDGDFWHGFRFPLWKHKMSPKWQEKIEKNRKRDQRNFRKIRRLGWKVLRIWEHQVEKNPENCISRIYGLLDKQ
jgi:DNA mismatch endonuclease (patch repair protein)